MKPEIGHGARQNILVTGFKAFGDYKSNPTEQILKFHSVLGEFALHSLIFPACSFGNGAENFGRDIVNKAVEVNAVAIISLGMNPDVRGIRIEKRAINMVENSDSKKIQIDPNWQTWYAKRVKLDYWDFDFVLRSLSAMNIRHEKELSEHPGTGCGNALMYRTLMALGPAYHIPYLFVHVPCTAEAISGLQNFDNTKDLITLQILRKMLVLLSEARCV